MAQAKGNGAYESEQVSPRLHLTADYTILLLPKNCFRQCRHSHTSCLNGSQVEDRVRSNQVNVDVTVNLVSSFKCSTLGCC